MADVNAFNATGRGPRAQQNTQYFTSPNINPGLSSPQAEAEAPGAGLSVVPPESFSAPGSMGGERDGPEATDAGILGGYMAGDRAQVVNGVLGYAGQMLGGAGGAALTGSPLGAQLGAALGGKALQGEQSMYSSGNPFDPARSNARSYAGTLLENGVPSGAAGVDMVKSARDADVLGAFLADQGIIPFGQSPYAAEVAANTPANPNGVGGYGASAGLNGPPSEAAAAAQAGAFADSLGGYAAGGTGGVGGDTGGIDPGGYYADGGQVLDRPVGLTASRFADGGAVDQPLLAMGFAQGGPLSGRPDPAAMNTQVNQLLRNPEVRNQLIARAQTLVQTGQLTPQEVQTLGQVAEAAMHNPQLYPQLRAFVAQQGMTPLPPEYDPTVIMKILAVARALQTGAQQPGAMPQDQGSTPPGQVPPTDVAAMHPPAGMNRGGFITGPGTGRSDSIGTVNESTGNPVKVANEEYVIPAHVVRAKGRDFFDNLLRRYSLDSSEAK